MKLCNVVKKNYNENNKTHPKTFQNAGNTPWQHSWHELSYHRFWQLFVYVLLGESHNDLSHWDIVLITVPRTRTFKCYRSMAKAIQKSRCGTGLYCHSSSNRRLFNFYLFGTRSSGILLKLFITSERNDRVRFTCIL